MGNIVEVIKRMQDSIYGKGVSEEEISAAEQLLGISFAPDYRLYLLTMGLAAADGREFTGIGKSRRTHVVDVTKSKRKNGPEILKTMYVIEDVGFDGIVVWQNSQGEIFETDFNKNPRKVGISFVDYLVR